jgi:hypothetical protein
MGVFLCICINVCCLNSVLHNLDVHYSKIVHETDSGLKMATYVRNMSPSKMNVKTHGKSVHNIKINKYFCVEMVSSSSNTVTFTAQRSNTDKLLSEIKEKSYILSLLSLVS